MIATRKTLALMLSTGLLGALVVGSLGWRLAWTEADREAEERAYCARALFRVAERHIGHDRLISEWRAELRGAGPAVFVQGEGGRP